MMRRDLLENVTAVRSISSDIFILRVNKWTFFIHGLIKRWIIIRFRYLKMINLLSEGHLIDQIMVLIQLLADLLPGNGNKHVKEGDIKNQDANHEADVVSEWAMDLGEVLMLLELEEGDERCAHEFCEGECDSKVTYRSDQ